MKKFQCIKKTQYKGSLIKPPYSVTVADGEAKAFDEHPCWQAASGAGTQPVTKPAAKK